MKIVLKTSLAFILIMLLSSTYANDTNSTNSWTWNQEMKKIRQEERKELHDSIKEKRNEVKNQIRENRDEIKDNLKSFREQNWTASWVYNNLSDEVKTQIEELREEHKTSIETIKNEYNLKIESASWSESKDALRLELRTKLEELNISYHEELKVLVGNDAEALAWVKARKEVALKNKEIREENQQARIEFRWERQSQIVAFKEKYHAQLWEKITKIWNKKPEKLETILTKIDAMIEKFEANTKLSETNKEKILSQLTALKELIEDTLDQDETLPE